MIELASLNPNVSDIFLMAENVKEIQDKVNILCEQLKRKNQQLNKLGCFLSEKVLAESSTMEKICSIAVKECRKRGNTTIKSSDRKEFKNVYAKYLIETL